MREFRRRIDLECFLPEKDLRTVFHARAQEIFLSRYGLDKATLYNLIEMSVFKEKKTRDNCDVFQLGPRLGRGYFCCKHFLNKNE